MACKALAESYLPLVYQLLYAGQGQDLLVQALVY